MPDAKVNIEISGFRERNGFKSACKVCQQPIYGKMYDMVMKVNDNNVVVDFTIGEDCWGLIKDEYKLLP